MKARNKKTGEIIEVEVYGEINDNGFAYKVPAGKDRWHLFREDELDFDDLTDWSSFRREAAKDILPAMINWRRVNEAGANILISKEEAAKLAIEYADELIKQLKQE